MIRIPPEAHIRSTIRPGSVYYFVERTLHSADPHYFIVVNDPMRSGEVVLLVSASSRTNNVERRRRRLPGTLVKITPEEYPGFTRDSVVDCNYVLSRSVQLLVEKLAVRELGIKPIMSPELLAQLRQAIQASPLVSGEQKKMLWPSK